MDQEYKFELPKDYATAIDHIADITSSLRSVTEKMNYFTTPRYQETILEGFNAVRDKFSTLESIHSMLPNIGSFSTVVPIIESSRLATSALTALSTAITPELVTAVSDRLKPWYIENIIGTSIHNPFISLPDTMKVNASLLGTELL